MSALYFRLATAVLILVLAVQKCDASTPIKYPTCQFSIATNVMYLGLVARGTGLVELQNVTCICYIGMPQISVISQSDAGIDYTTSPVVCEGILDCTGVLGPNSDCRDINHNILSMVNLTGTFNHSAVIECWTEADPNKASPLVVWVDHEPAVNDTVSCSESMIKDSTTPIVEETPSTSSTTPIVMETPSMITCSSPSSSSVCTISTTTSFITTTQTLSATCSPSPINIPDINTPDSVSSTVSSTESVTALVASSSTLVIILVVIIVVLVVVLAGLCYHQHKKSTRVAAAERITVLPKEKSDNKK